MKKNFLYIPAMLFALAACNKEQPEGPVAGLIVGEGETLVRLTGKIDAPTKVEFDNLQGLFSWSSGDEIAVHVSAGVSSSNVEVIPPCYKFATMVPNADPSTSEFFFVMSEGQKRDFYAVYPAAAADEDNYGDDDLKITLPSSYDIPAAGMETWSPTPMIAVNDPSSEELRFRHVGGLLRLTLNDVDPATRSISISLGSRITGSFTVNDPSTSVPYIATEDGEDEIVFNLIGSLSGYTDNLVLNVPVPTGTYGNLRITTRNASGATVYTYSDETQRIFDAGRGRMVTPSVSTLPIPLCLEAVEPATVHVANPLGLTMEYSRDNQNWTSFNSNLEMDLLPEECIYLRGDNPKYTDLEYEEGNHRMALNRRQANTSVRPMGDEKDDYDDRTIITTDGRCYIYGNIMSLVDAQNFDTATTLTGEDTFVSLFMEAGELLSHPDKSLILPATTLTRRCYAGMFEGCAGLSVAPELPATQLAFACYEEMFESCESLVRGPSALPAMQMEEACYCAMFSGCSSLRMPPALPATQLAIECYSAMFESCVSLQVAPELPATTLAKKCYQDMFYKCTSLTEAPELPATELAERCYSYMFERTAISEMPILPATTLAEKCYESMFSRCENLVTVHPLPATVMKSNCYARMFEQCSSLVTAPQLSAEELAPYCYEEMFYYCSSLSNAPALPATTLAESCYAYMFEGCSSLQTAPDLPATDVPDRSYNAMFRSCTSLTQVPEISAETAGESSFFGMFYNCTGLQTAAGLTIPSTIGRDCCYNMFSGCTSLTQAPELPATTLAESCYAYMFENCTSLTRAPELPALDLEARCYSSMFHGCTNLNYVKALFVGNYDLSDYWSSPMGAWLEGVASTGTFVKNAAAQWEESNVVPSGWTVESVTL